MRLRIAVLSENTDGEIARIRNAFIGVIVVVERYGDRRGRGRDLHGAVGDAADGTAFVPARAKIDAVREIVKMPSCSSIIPTESVSARGFYQFSRKKESGRKPSASLYLRFFFFLGDDFLAVVIAAVLAHAVRDLQLMAMRALDRASPRSPCNSQNACWFCSSTALSWGLAILLHLFLFIFPIAHTTCTRDAREARTSTNRAKNSSKRTLPFV